MPHLRWYGSEELEYRLQIFPHLTYTRHVGAAVAVVRCTPDCNHGLAVEVVFVSFVDKLMCSGDQIEVIDCAELVGYSATKQPA